MVVENDLDPKDVNTDNPPDLVNFKITNPLVYIKYWWKKIMSNEGIDFRLHVKPVTAFGIALIAFSLAFGLGGVVLPNLLPGKKDIQPTPVPTTSGSPTPTILKDTALRGTLAKTSTYPTRFYLVTTSTEAVTLNIPSGFNLLSLVGKRILAIGGYNQKEKILNVTDIQDLEVLSTTPVPIPTSTPSPTPSPTIAPTPISTIEPTVSPIPTQ